MPLNNPFFLDQLGQLTRGSNSTLDNGNLSGNVLSSKGGNISNTPNMGYHKYQTQYVLRDFFKDRDTFNFKHGLEVGLNSNLDTKSTDHSILNLDEDPTIFGFDLVILDKSALFNDVDHFLEFGSSNNIKDVSERVGIYDDFVTQFAKFFNVDDRNKEIFKSNNRFNSFKTHYIHGIQGLDKIIHHTGIGYEGGKQMVDYGKDKITIELTEDIGVNAGYLSALYRSFIYSKINGRMVIPENLLRFDMAIIISEVRNMNRVSNAIAKSMKDSRELIPILKDNVSRYIFTLYDCQFNFNKYSFSDSITQGGFGASVDGVSKGIGFDVYYKYVGMEMEKFDFRPDLPDMAKFINDGKTNPITNQINPNTDSGVNQNTDALIVDKYPNRPMDRKFHMNTNANSDVEDRMYEFDFPMMNTNYIKSNIEARNKNLQIQSDETQFKRGLNKIIGNINEGLQTKFIERRSQLLSGLVSKIRQSTGIRNIPAPVNVYAGSNLGQFALDQLHNFVNLGVGTVLSKGHGYMDNLAQGMENSVFDVMNRGTNSLKGHGDIPHTTRDILGNGGIPNVYRDR